MVTFSMEFKVAADTALVNQNCAADPATRRAARWIVALQRKFVSPTALRHKPNRGD